MSGQHFGNFLFKGFKSRRWDFDGKSSAVRTHAISCVGRAVIIQFKSMDTSIWLNFCKIGQLLPLSVDCIERQGDLNFLKKKISFILQFEMEF